MASVDFKLVSSADFVSNWLKKGVLELSSLPYVLYVDLAEGGCFSTQRTPRGSAPDTLIVHVLGCWS